MSEISLTWVPVYESTLNQFASPNPWSDGRPATWNLNRYRMAPASYVETGKSGHFHNEVLGLVAAGNKGYHILPVALRNLWLEGRVPVDALPRLTHMIENGLELRDYVSWARRMQFVFAWLLLFLPPLAAAVVWDALYKSDFSGSYGMWLTVGIPAVFLYLGPIQGLRLKLRDRRHRGALLAMLDATAETSRPRG